MHRWIFLISGIVSLLLMVGMAAAQDEDSFGQGGEVCRFVDEDGDGFNDLAPDDDGDGIPNGLDPDYVRPKDGTGQKRQHMWLGGIVSRMFGRAIQFQQNEQAFGTGPGPGMNSGFGPGESSGQQGSAGEGQANQAGHRNGRR